MAKKEKQPEPFNAAFAGLKVLKEKDAKKAPAASAPAPKAPPKKQLDDDAALFLEAVGEVERVRRGPERVAPPPPRTADEITIPTEEAESLAQLAELVSGEGEFDLADSDEFIEGTVHGLDPRVLRSLRRGDYSTQAHVDLHGLTKAEAQPALDAFIQRSRVAGHRCVLIVTGRGLHSKDQVPVLKSSVQAWLTRGRTAKQVLAFCSARPQHGGSGALYVLLRR